MNFKWVCRGCHGLSCRLERDFYDTPKKCPDNLAQKVDWNPVFDEGVPDDEE